MLARAAEDDYGFAMIIIRFADHESKRLALGHLVGRYSFKSWASGEMMPLTDDAEVPIGFLKILRDRTAQRQAIQALKDSEARTRLALEAGELGAWESSPALRELIWDARLKTASNVISPTRRKVELEVHGEMLAAGRETQTHAHLAVGNLPGRAGVLALHANRVSALLEKT